jgi:hypothetical protein
MIHSAVLLRLIPCDERHVQFPHQKNANPLTPTASRNNSQIFPRYLKRGTSGTTFAGIKKILHLVMNPRTPSCKVTSVGDRERKMKG